MHRNLVNRVIVFFSFTIRLHVSLSILWTSLSVKHGSSLLFKEYKFPRKFYERQFSLLAELEVRCLPFVTWPVGLLAKWNLEASKFYLFLKYGSNSATYFNAVKAVGKDDRATKWRTWSWSVYPVFYITDKVYDIINLAVKSHFVPLRVEAICGGLLSQECNKLLVLKRTRWKVRLH